MSITSNSNSSWVSSATSHMISNDLCVVQPATTWDGGPLLGSAVPASHVRTLQAVSGEQFLADQVQISEKFHFCNYSDNSPQVRYKISQYSSQDGQNYALGAVVGGAVGLAIIMTGTFDGSSAFEVIREFVATVLQ